MKSPTFIKKIHNNFKEEILSDNKSIFTFEPLNTGLGHTLGNSLRRTLISRIEGAAVTSIAIDKCDHEFSSIQGVKEDVIEIIENIKKLSFDPIDIKDTGTIINIEINGKNLDFVSSHINNFTHAKPFQQDIVIMHVDLDSSINLQLFVERGFRYKNLSYKNAGFEKEICINANFSPVELVHYSVESSTILGQECFDKLIITLETKHSNIKPYDVLLKAINTLQNDYSQLEIAIQDNEYTLNNPEEINIVELEYDINSDENLISIDEIPTRCKNSLKKANINTLKDLLSKTKNELCEIENLGKISVENIQKYLAGRGLFLKQEDKI